jgi:predicted Rossmann-fold nucleotide-binding protein
MNAMFNHVDAFIALPGGLGILEEIFHISSWAHDATILFDSFTHI